MVDKSNSNTIKCSHTNYKTNPSLNSNNYANTGINNESETLKFKNFNLLNTKRSNILSDKVVLNKFKFSIEGIENISLYYIDVINEYTKDEEKNYIIKTLFENEKSKAKISKAILDKYFKFFIRRGRFIYVYERPSVINQKKEIFVYFDTNKNNEILNIFVFNEQNKINNLKTLYLNAEANKDIQSSGINTKLKEENLFKSGFFNKDNVHNLYLIKFVLKDKLCESLDNDYYHNINTNLLEDTSLDKNCFASKVSSIYNMSSNKLIHQFLNILLKESYNVNNYTTDKYERSKGKALVIPGFSEYNKIVYKAKSNNKSAYNNIQDIIKNNYGYHFIEGFGLTTSILSNMSKNNNIKKSFLLTITSKFNLIRDITYFNIYEIIKDNNKYIDFIFSQNIKGQTIYNSKEVKFENIIFKNLNELYFEPSNNFKNNSGITFIKINPKVSVYDYYVNHVHYKEYFKQNKIELVKYQPVLVVLDRIKNRRKLEDDNYELYYHTKELYYPSQLVCVKGKFDFENFDIAKETRVNANYKYANQNYLANELSFNKSNNNNYFKFNFEKTYIKTEILNLPELKTGLKKNQNQLNMLNKNTNNNKHKNTKTSNLIDVNGDNCKINIKEIKPVVSSTLNNICFIFYNIDNANSNTIKFVLDTFNKAGKSMNVEIDTKNSAIINTNDKNKIYYNKSIDDIFENLVKSKKYINYKIYIIAICGKNKKNKEVYTNVKKAIYKRKKIYENSVNQLLKFENFYSNNNAQNLSKYTAIILQIFAKRDYRIWDINYVESLPKEELEVYNKNKILLGAYIVGFYNNITYRNKYNEDNNNSSCLGKALTTFLAEDINLDRNDFHYFSNEFDDNYHKVSNTVQMQITTVLNKYKNQYNYLPDYFIIYRENNQNLNKLIEEEIKQIVEDLSDNKTKIIFIFCNKLNDLMVYKDNNINNKINDSIECSSIKPADLEYNNKCINNADIGTLIDDVVVRPYAKDCIIEFNINMTKDLKKVVKPTQYLLYSKDLDIIITSENYIIEFIKKITFYQAFNGKLVFTPIKFPSVFHQVDRMNKFSLKVLGEELTLGECRFNYAL